MSDTPRVDKDEFEAGEVDADSLVVTAEDARQLERELNEARAQLTFVAGLHSIALARAETAEARLLAHEAVRDLCLAALPECQVWGDVPGHIKEMRDKLAAIAPVREKLETITRWHGYDYHHASKPTLDLVNDALRLLEGAK